MYTCSATETMRATAAAEAPRAARLLVVARWRRQPRAVVCRAALSSSRELSSSSPPGAWAAWDAFVRRLAAGGYFAASAKGEDFEEAAAAAPRGIDPRLGDAADHKRACVEFGRRRAPLLARLHDASVAEVLRAPVPDGTYVGGGRKLINGVKRLRAWYGVDELHEVRGECAAAAHEHPVQGEASLADLTRLLFCFATALPPEDPSLAPDRAAADEILVALAALDAELPPAPQKPPPSAARRPGPTRKERRAALYGDAGGRRGRRTKDTGAGDGGRARAQEGRGREQELLPRPSTDFWTS